MNEYVWMNDLKRMKIKRHGSLLLLLAVMLIPAYGCGDDTSARTNTTADTTQTLPAERIAELAQMYPVLRPDPQPEPQPSPDASPEQVPDRLAAALDDDVLETVTGDASFYADTFEGRRTASGVPFRQNQLVAAHRAYPFGTVLRVTNLNNDRAVNVRVVDRGPFGNSAKAKRRVIDVSRRAANQLGFVGAGHAQVRIEVLEWGRGLRG